MQLADTITFNDTRPTGEGKPVFPAICWCSTCHNTNGIIVGGVMIDDPELAIKILLIRQGYTMAINESRANRHQFARMDGHDGLPCDWQQIFDPKPCTCKATPCVDVHAGGEDLDVAPEQEQAA